MERTKETLEARVRETPLVDRLKECRQRIGKMCSEGRPPRMCIPVQHDDDDFFISTTLSDAQATVEALQREWDRLREALEEIACDIAGSPKRKLMIADDNFWATPGEHTLRQWIARAALTPAGGAPLDTK